jgi:hypothetical protein
MAEFKWPPQGGSVPGTVIGPGSSVDNSVPRFNGVSGELLQDSGVIIDDSDNVTGVESLTVDGLTASRVVLTDANKKLESSVVAIDADGDATGFKTISIRNDDNLDGSAQNMIQMDNRNDDPESHGHIEFRRARASNANLANGDEIGGVNFHPRQNSVTQSAAEILAVYTGDGTTRLADVTILTSNGGAPTERMRVKADGSINVSGLTADRVVVTDADKDLASSATTATELSYVAGVTSAIQTQLDAKVDENAPITGATKTKITYDAKGLVTAGADLAAGDLPTGIDATKIADGTVTNAEFQYIGGLTSDAQTQINAKADSSALTAHINDTTDAHDASAISVTPSGNLAATDVQGALTELQTDVDTRAPASTAVTLTGTEVITNKDIDGGTAANNRRITVPKDTYANLLLLTRKEGTLLYATDLDTFFADDGSTLTAVGSGSGSGTGEKNYVENPSATVAITGWTAVNDLDVARTTTASELPREHTTGAGIKITADANTQSVADYVYFDFTLDDVDLSKKLKIEWSQKLFGAYTAGQLAVIITTQADRTTALHTPVTTAIPAADGVFTTSFDSSTTATLSLVIRATGDMTTDTGIVISDVVVGPGTITQGAAVSEWETWAPVWTGLGSVTNQISKYRRAGSSIEIQGRVLGGTATGDPVTFTLPNSWTHTTAQASVVGDASTNGTLTTIHIQLAATTSNAVGIGNDAAFAGYIVGTQIGNSKVISYNATIIIDQLAGNGTVNLGAGAQVEYAATSGTWDADSSTTAYGPAGSAMGGTVAGTRLKTITWQYPIQADDMFSLEVSKDRINWVPVNGSQVGPSNTNVVCALDAAGNAASGLWFRGNTSSTQSLVVLCQYANIANDDSPATNWPSSDAFWRVRKAKAGSAVGFGMAGTDGSAGLYKAGLAPGLVTGAAIPAGYVGERITGTMTNNAIAVSGTVYNAGSIPLTAGTWMLYGKVAISPAGTTHSQTDVGISATSATFEEPRRARDLGTSAGLNRFIVAEPAYVNLNSAQTYYLVMTAAYTGTAPAAIGTSSEFYAVRIA